MRSWPPLVLLLLAAACAEGTPAPDGGALEPDVGADAAPSEREAGAPDAPVMDAPGPAPDAALFADARAEDAAGTPDAGPAPPLAGSFVRLSAADGTLAAGALDELVVAADGALILGTGHGGTDPYGPGGYQGGEYYNGGTYRYGVFVSPVLEWAELKDELVPSFEAETPPGTWVTVKLRARVAGRWTRDYVLGVWAFEQGTVRRHSVEGQGDADGDVLTDTLVLSGPADAVQLVAVLCAEGAGATPRVGALSLSAIARQAPPPPDPGDPSVWGTVLPVPGRSQMVYPDGGEVWCSPTSTAMLLAYWSQELGEAALLETVPAAAGYTYDWIYDGHGNWPFNTAHAAAVAGGRLSAFVTRLSSFGQIERLIARRIPVAISVSYGPGELGGSPIRSTAGHLLVVKGFGPQGQVVANDPAFGADDRVEVSYDRGELDRAWSHSARTAYVVYPDERVLPRDPLGAY